MRLPNWETALFTFLQERAKRPFAWGTHDCGIMVCDWLAIVTGIDPAAEIRGTYSDQLGAYRAVGGVEGFEAFADGIASTHNWPEVPPAFARRGDVVLIDTETGPMLGICAGRDSVFPGADGLISRRTRQCRKAWRIE